MLRSEALFLRSGKVRDLYRLDDERLLLVASDRISAFDVVLPTPIPDKGRVLTGLSRFWFAQTADIVPNHLLATDPAVLPPELIADPVVRDELRGRMMIGRHADVLPVECVVRGYLSGSGWKEYRAKGEVCEIPLPPGLRESERLAEPIFTPAWKAPAGVHDENIPFARVQSLISHDLATRVRESSLALYRRGAAVCERAGIILADTKFEFGLLPDGELLLVDEILTPDSSRFWDAATYEPGRAQASYDKQFVRDWLEAQPWDKTAPGPYLPGDVVAGTRARYVEAFERITGASFDRYLQEDVIAPMSEPTRAYRFAVNVTPKPGILDPQGRAVERSLPHLGIAGVSGVRVGRRVELVVHAPDEAAARAIVQRLASELLSNPLIEAFAVEALGDAAPGDAASPRSPA